MAFRMINPTRALDFNGEQCGFTGSANKGCVNKKVDFIPMCAFKVSKAAPQPLSLSSPVLLPSLWLCVTSAPSSLTLGLPPLSHIPPFLLPLLLLLMAHGMACSLQTCCCPSTTLFLLASHWSLAGPRLPIGRPGSAHCPHHSHLSRHMRREGANTPGLPEHTCQLEI